MATTIQIRRDSSTNWQTVNPILANGEFGKETDTGKIKNGDGVTAWNDLPYCNSDVDLSNYVKRFILNIDNIANGVSGTLTKNTWDKITGDYLVCVNSDDCLFNNVQIIVTEYEKWIYFRDHLAKKDVEIYIVLYDVDNTITYNITLS